MPSAFAGALGENGFGQGAGFFAVTFFDDGQIAEQFAHADVLRGRRGLGVKTLGVGLHRLRLAADGLERQVLDQPGRAAAQKALHVLTADSGQVLAKTPLVHFEQLAAMAVLLGRHFLENFRRGGVAFRQLLGETQIDAAVFFFGGDGDGEDFTFGQIGKVFQRHA